MKQRGWLLLIMVLALLISACSGGAAADENGDSLEGDLTQAPGTQVPPGTDLEVEGADALVETVRPLVGEEAGVNAGELTLISVEPVTWRDGSLGCPQPGMAYIQMIIEGWRVKFEDASGKVYDVHVGQEPENLVICEQATEEDASAAPPPPADLDRNPAADAAVALLKRYLDAAADETSADEVTVLQVESVEWRNSCLGCAAQGENCLMVITPGYRVTLSDGEQTYTVHTDSTGEQAILCEDGTPLVQR